MLQFLHDRGLAVVALRKILGRVGSGVETLVAGESFYGVGKSYYKSIAQFLYY